MAATTPSRRADVIADHRRRGRELCRALATATDELLAELYAAAVAARAPRRRGAVALVAVGGYGRGELAPHSDVDVLLVHERKATGIDDLAGRLWYPLWDSGLKLGHAVRSLDDQMKIAAGDLEVATAMLSTRWLAGDEELAERVATESLAQWRRNGRRWLDALRARVDARRELSGDVAYTLEPDLKEGHGGLRDVQSLWWAADADLVLPGDDAATLTACYETLVDVRVGLHRVTGRPGDVLRLEDQDAVADHLGAASADALMADVAAAARTVAWIAGGTWRHMTRHQVGRDDVAADGVVVSDGQVELASGADLVADPAVVLRAARVAAERDLPLGRSSIDRMVAELSAEPWPHRWPDGARDELVSLLAQGHPAIDVLETLDQRGLLVRMLPEWAPVQSRPQRNAYHRFTVDRHLWEAAANAAAVTDRVRRPDLLLLGALFHDLGKGYPGDHTVAGMALVAEIGPRLGLSGDDTATLVRLVQHHLLLPDVAVRRDLADPATARQVGGAVGDIATLELLHALTEADSLATGPSAWGPWKAQLVADLVDQTRSALAGAEPAPDAGRRFPDDATVAAMAAGTLDVRVEGAAERPADTGAITGSGTASGTEFVTVVCPDRPGAFARIAGVLSLRGLDVLAAWAWSGSPHGEPMAASRFCVTVPAGGARWDAVTADLRRALAGELAIEARLAERARTYRRRRVTRAAPPAPPAVVFHDDASTRASVVEVRAPNRIGVLHGIANALTELGLDIRRATVQTLGEDVVDTFYVCTAAGDPVTDEFHRAEISRAVLHAAGDVPGGGGPPRRCQ